MFDEQKENEKVVIGKKTWHFFRYQVLVIKDKNLGAYDKATYGAINSYADTNTGLCYPSLSTLTERAGCSKQRLIKSIKNLVNAGYIKKEKRKNDSKVNKSNIYKVIDLSYIHNAKNQAEKLDKKYNTKEITKAIEKRLQKHPVPSYEEINSILNNTKEKILNDNKSSKNEIDNQNKTQGGVVRETNTNNNQKNNNQSNKNSKAKLNKSVCVGVCGYINNNIINYNKKACEGVCNFNNNNKFNYYKLTDVSIAKNVNGKKEFDNKQKTQKQSKVKQSSFKTKNTEEHKRLDNSKASQTLSNEVEELLNYYNKKLSNYYKISNFSNQANTIKHRLKEIEANTSKKGLNCLKKVIDVVNHVKNNKKQIQAVKEVLDGNKPTPQLIFSNYDTVKKLFEAYEQNCNIKNQDFYSKIAQLYYEKFSSPLIGNKLGDKIFNLIKTAYKDGMSGEVIIYALNQVEVGDHPNYFKAILRNLYQSEIKDLTSAKEFIQSKHQIDNCQYPKKDCLNNDCPAQDECPIYAVIQHHIDNTGFQISSLETSTKQMVDDRLAVRSLDEILTTLDNFAQSWVCQTKCNNSLQTVLGSNQKMDKYFNREPSEKDKSSNKDNNNATSDKSKSDDDNALVDSQAIDKEKEVFILINLMFLAMTPIKTI